MAAICRPYNVYQAILSTTISWFRLNSTISLQPSTVPSSCTSLPESYATSKEAVPTKAVPSHVGLNGNEEAESQSKQPPLRQKSVATMPPLRPIGNHGTVLAATWP